MHTNRQFADTAALFSDPARASMLMALLDGVAMPAGQLALIANIAPQTASSHLSKLIAGQVLSVEQQGRHRYFRLANAEVATAIETLLAISPKFQNSGSNGVSHSGAATGSLAYARTCYSHLAGRLAVNIAETLEKREMLLPLDARRYKLTECGRRWLEQLGMEVRERDLNDAKFARRCLDWTERRHHLAGRLGSALLKKFQDLKWIAPLPGTRAVRITLEGRQRLDRLLGAHLPFIEDSVLERSSAEP